MEKINNESPLHQQNANEVFSYAEYHKQHEAHNALPLREKIKHRIKHHKVTKTEYQQIYDELKQLDPNEPIVWMGKPSQVTNLFAYIVCFLFSPLLFPLVIAYYIYIKTKRTIYVITDERLRVYSGVFIRRIDDVELYRVKDTIYLQPFFLAWFGLCNIQLITSDATWGDAIIAGIPNGRMIREKIRHVVEKAREKKGVREVDYYTRGEPMPPHL